MRTRSLVSRVAGAALLGLGLLCMPPPPAAAQAVSGTILGFVKDSTGAVVPGATVTLVNTGTGFSRTVVTNATGEYTAPLIPTGTYTVSAEITGFKKVSKTNVLLGVDQKVRIDVALELGAMTEVVEIQAETPLLQTSSSDLGTTVVEEQIKTLPLNGRNFVSLTRTVPGVLRGIPGGNIDGAGSLAWRASAGFSANGQRSRDNNYMLDGVDNNETWLQTVVVFPSPDALEEFKLQTSTYSAEFGKSLGGVVSLQIKSGTNQYHGSVFEFLRNDAFDANNWFNNRAGRKKGDLSQNQFGGTFGGPIIKDKTFIFADYQGLRLTSAQTYLSTVPTMRMRQGDFSELTRVIYDPLNPGTAFPGNVIPQNRWDPASANIMSQLYPEPNTEGTRNASTGQTINNYLINPTVTREDNQFDVKLDHRLTQNNRFFIRYSYDKTHRFQPATLEHGDAGATFGAGDGNIKGQSIAFNDTHTFSPNFINEFRFGWNSIKFFMTPLDYGTNMAEQMGIPGINLNESTSAMTQLNFQNIRNLGANSNQPLITNQNDFQVFDSVTWIKNRHTFKLGGSITWRSREILNADTIVGNFSFNNNMTSNCAGTVSGCTLNTSTGFDVASFLLGYATGKSRNLFDAATYTEKRPEYAVYLQDDWRVSSKLTLNLGLRYEVFVPWVEVDNRQSNFDESTGQVRDRLGQRRDRRRQRRPLPPDLLEGRHRPAVRLRLRRLRHGPHDPPRRRGQVLELHPGRHVVVQGAEPAVPAVDGAHGLTEHERTRRASRSRTACRPRRASTRTARPREPPGRSSTSTSATATPSTGTSTSSSSSSRTTWSRWPTRARKDATTSSRGTRTSRRPPWASRTPTSSGLTSPSLPPCAPSARCRARASSTTTPCS